MFTADLKEAAPLFRAVPCSQARLRALAERHEAKTHVWDFDAASANVTQIHPLFRLKTQSLPELYDKRKQTLGDSTGMQSLNADQTEKRPDSRGDSSQGGTKPASPSMHSTGSGPRSSNLETLFFGEKPKTRADKYFEAMMKAHNKREKIWKEEAYAEEIRQANVAAERASKKFKPPATPRSDPEFSDDSSAHQQETESESSDDEDVGPLRPYDGAFKIELEIVVMRPPGMEDATTTEDSGSVREEVPSEPEEDSSESQTSTPREDLTAELQALQDELGNEQEAEEEDDMPDFMKTEKKGPKSIVDADDPRFYIGFGGTTFYVPDVERYALASSLPPPPPPSEFGTRMNKLKPRLPLSISNHRYKDEHPSIDLARPPFVPSVQDRKNMEEHLKTLHFYQASNKSMTKLIGRQISRNEKLQMTGGREKKTLEEKLKAESKDFDELVEKDLKGSLAWRIYLKRLAKSLKVAEKHTPQGSRAGSARSHSSQGSRAGSQASKQAAQDRTQKPDTIKEEDSPPRRGGSDLKRAL